MFESATRLITFTSALRHAVAAPVLRDGKRSDRDVGREGVVGAMAGLGLYKSLVRIRGADAGSLQQIAATHFRTVAAGSDPSPQFSASAQRVLLSQARVTARLQFAALDRGAISSLAAAERGSGRKRTRSRDTGVSRRNARRAAHLVTEVASKVQAAGVITIRAA